MQPIVSGGNAPRGAKSRIASMSAGKLKVTVCEARGLAAKDDTSEIAVQSQAHT
jgi:hypothetical protein